MRRLALIAAVTLGLSACVIDYDYRDFGAVDKATSWGSVDIRLSGAYTKTMNSRSHGSPYVLTIRPRLNVMPGPDCKLTVRRLTLTRRSGGAQVFALDQLELASQPPGPYDYDYRPFNAHFDQGPGSKAYSAFGRTQGLDLSHEPYDLAFDLVGGESCPEGLRSSHPVAAVFEPRLSQGVSTPVSRAKQYFP